jgi:hypothetical protein
MPIRLKRAYFVVGPQPKHWENVYEVKDAPAGGYHWVLVDDQDPYQFILHPQYLTTHKVSMTAGELKDVPERELNEAYWIDHIEKKLQYALGQDLEIDYQMVALFLSILKGEKVEVVKKPETSKKKKGGKPLNAEAFKPVRMGSKRGEVAHFFINEIRSVEDAERELGMSRNNVLTHLFSLNKYHGLGYIVNGGMVELLTPKDIDIFE